MIQLITNNLIFGGNMIKEKSYFYKADDFPEIIVNKSGRIKSLAESCQFTLPKPVKMTKEELQKSIKFGDVFTTEEFQRYNEEKLFIWYDGIGYFHDGEKETNESVWDEDGRFRKDLVEKYPFVCWYNK